MEDALIEQMDVMNGDSTTFPLPAGVREKTFGFMWSLSQLPPHFITHRSR